MLALEEEVSELRAQNLNLKKVMKEKEDTHSLHLRAYQDGQGKQAMVIQELQTKVTFLYK